MKHFILLKKIECTGIEVSEVLTTRATWDEVLELIKEDRKLPAKKMKIWYEHHEIRA